MAESNNKFGGDTGVDADYWIDDDTYPVADWKYEVANGDTLMGYHEWLRQHKEEEI